jgi:hypothetical protein
LLKNELEYAGPLDTLCRTIHGSRNYGAMHKKSTRHAALQQFVIEEWFSGELYRGDRFSGSAVTRSELLNE